MTHVALAFSRIFAWLPFHHVALVHGDEIIEAVGWGKHPIGVRKRSLYDFLADHKHVQFRETEGDPEIVWALAETQVGKPYDWSWYIGHLLGSRKWQDPHRWTCHELVFWALGYDAEVPRLTPRDLIQISERI